MRGRGPALAPSVRRALDWGSMARQSRTPRRIQTRVDPAVAEEATDVLHGMGLTVSDAVRLFLAHVSLWTK